jgi:WD40 repeat protein
VFTCDDQNLQKNIELRSDNPAEAERILSAGLPENEKLRVQQAFRLSASALADEPSEWPTQILARLKSDKSSAIQSVLRRIAGSREGCWLKPVRAPLIASDGPIVKIVNVGAPYDESRALIWSKDRSTITSFRNSSFRTWNLRLQREANRLDLPIDWGQAAISDPPRRAVVMALQRQLLLVDLESASVEVIFTGNIIELVAMSADGARAVTSSVPPTWDYSKHDWRGPRTLRLFDLDRKSCIRTWTAHRGRITDLALSEDGRFLATASRDQTAQLVDLAKAKTIGLWRCARDVDAVALTPSGHRIAYVSRGGTLVVRRRNGEVIQRLANCGAEPGCVALSKDGHKVVLAIGGTVSVVDLRIPNRLGPFLGTQPYLSSLVIDDHANQAITGELGGQLVLWDLTKLKRALSGDWTSGIWAGSDRALVHQDAISLWDLSSGKRTEFRAGRHCEVTAAPSAGMWAIASWSPDGRGSIRIGRWGHRQTKPLVQSRDLSRSMLPTMHFSRNGKRLLVHIHKFGCRILNPANGRTVWQRRNLGLGVRPFLSPSGRYVLSFWYNGRLEVVDLDTGELIQQAQLQPITGKVLFAEDDDRIFIPQGNETTLLNWKTTASTILCQGTPSSISDDGRWLVTEFHRKLTLWKLPHQHRAATFTLDVSVLHTALSPDGRFLIAGDQNGGIHILQREG